MCCVGLHIGFEEFLEMLLGSWVRGQELGFGYQGMGACHTIQEKFSQLVRNSIMVRLIHLIM